MRFRCSAVALIAVLGIAGSASAQDTTQAYPWRMSYFPYPVVTPNDGLMGVARVIFFRQSRWDDRVSLHDGIAIDAGYSTKDAWLARVKGDFPRIAEGWRVQGILQAGKHREFFSDPEFGEAVSRQAASLEITRSLGGPVSLALRGEKVHLSGAHPTTLPGQSIDTFSENDTRGRLALVVDLRDREYDTRSGALIQGGFILGTSSSVYRNPYRGWYGLASGWISLSRATRLTARVGGQTLNRRSPDGGRVIPGWEDEFVVGGGPESNRALPLASEIDDKMLLASIEVRHDVFTFPGGAIALLAFVDGGRAYCDCDVTVMNGSSFARFPWRFGPGGGIAVRLLRNAIMTATVGVAKGKARVYVGTGWSW
jgi:hypothetical protein